MNLQDNKNLISEYYQRVDKQDIDWVLELFSDDASYVRADAEYKSKKAINDFYRNDRKIVGRHIIEHIIAEDDEVVASGVFKGEGADGSKKLVGFSDVWILQGDKAKYRQTYLSIGADYVKD